jgi:allantoinase
MLYDLIVKNGQIVLPTTVIKADLLVKDGKVCGMVEDASQLNSKEEVDASGKYVMPGAIDPHVHAGHGEPHRETFESASMAAAAGGVTTFIDMPLSQPSTVTIDEFNKKIDAVNSKSVVDIALYGGLVKEFFEDIPAINEAGGQAYKAFMCRCSNFYMTNDGDLLEGMELVAELGGVVTVHAENDTLINNLVERYQKEGQNDIEAFLNSHPRYAEFEAVQRFLYFAELVPEVASHIAHMSIPEGAEEIKYARSNGVNISVETCPQYLGLNTDDIFAKGGIAKCDPPVRPQEVVDHLWEYVFDGTIDMIASDHSPHTFDEKVVPLDEFDKAKNGCTGLQTMIPVVVDEGIIKRGMPLSLYARFTALNAAYRFGLYPHKGSLQVGFDADFYLLDLEDSWTCNAKDLFYTNKHSAYDGRTFSGKITATFVRGTKVYDGKNILVKPGYGKYVAMNIE